MKIEHHEPSIIQTVLVTPGDGNEQRMTFAFTTTGNETPAAIGGGVGRTAARWQGPELVIESTLKVADRELHFRDHWSLSQDGSTLTMAHPDDDLAGQVSILEPASPQDAKKLNV